jgi:hypothetical protein
MEQRTFKLRIPEGLTFEDVIQGKDKGNRFVFFAYLIPLPLFYPIRRISGIYYLRPGDKASDYNTKYNLITLFWGWWGMPFGPGRTYSVIVNNRTGIDVTEDVYHNLTKEDFAIHEVTIKKINNIFIHPDKSIVRELTMCFKKHSQKQAAFNHAPVVAYYIDTNEPCYYIGLHFSDSDKIESLKKEIYKYFFKKVKFEFVDINGTSENIEKLRSQGLTIDLSL